MAAVDEAERVRPSACPRCGAPLISQSDDALRCDTDDVTFRREGGIWRFLDPSRPDHEAFTDQYRTVRQAERWGSAAADYYRRLPYEDLTGQHAEIWRIRAITYRHFLRSVLTPLDAMSEGHALRIVDLGAGNGWLASRLTERGYLVAALDLDDDPRDGLGAIVHYGDQAPAESLQASFDRLPWDDGALDLVIYNGSLHYSAEQFLLGGAAGNWRHAGGRGIAATVGKNCIGLDRCPDVALWGLNGGWR